MQRLVALGACGEELSSPSSSSNKFLAKIDEISGISSGGGSGGGSRSRSNSKASGNGAIPKDGYPVRSDVDDNILSSSSSFYYEEDEDEDEYDDDGEALTNRDTATCGVLETASSFLTIELSQETETKRSLRLLHGCSIIEFEGNVLVAAYDSGGFEIFSIVFDEDNISFSSSPPLSSSSSSCSLHLMASINRSAPSCDDPSMIVTAIKICSSASRRLLAVGHLDGSIAIFNIISNGNDIDNNYSSTSFAISFEREYSSHECEISTIIFVDDTLLSLDTSGLFLECNILSSPSSMKITSTHRSKDRNNVKKRRKKKEEKSVLDFTLSFLDLTKALTSSSTTTSRFARGVRGEEDGDDIREDSEEDAFRESDEDAYDENHASSRRSRSSGGSVTNVICQLNKFSHKVVAAKSTTTTDDDSHRRKNGDILVLMSINDAAVLFSRSRQQHDKSGGESFSLWTPLDIKPEPSDSRSRSSDGDGCSATVVLTAIFQTDIFDKDTAIGIIGLKSISLLNTKENYNSNSNNNSNMGGNSSCVGSSNQLALHLYLWDLQGTSLHSIPLFSSPSPSIMSPPPLELDDAGNELLEVVTDLFLVTSGIGRGERGGGAGAGVEGGIELVGISNYFRFFSFSMTEAAPEKELKNQLQGCNLDSNPIPAPNSYSNSNTNHSSYSNFKLHTEIPVYWSCAQNADKLALITKGADENDMGLLVFRIVPSFIPTPNPNPNPISNTNPNPNPNPNTIPASTLTSTTATSNEASLLLSYDFESEHKSYADIVSDVSATWNKIDIDEDDAKVTRDTLSQEDDAAKSEKEGNNNDDNNNNNKNNDDDDDGTDAIFVDSKSPWLELYWDAGRVADTTTAATVGSTVNSRLKARRAGYSSDEPDRRRNKVKFRTGSDISDVASIAEPFQFELDEFGQFHPANSFSLDLEIRCNSSNILATNSNDGCTASSYKFAVDKDLGLNLIYNSQGRLEVASFPDNNIDNDNDSLNLTTALSRSNMRQLVSKGDILIAIGDISIRNKSDTFISNLLEKQLVLLRRRSSSSCSSSSSSSSSPNSGNTIRLTFEFGSAENSDEYNNINNNMLMSNGLDNVASKGGGGDFTSYLEESVTNLPFFIQFLDLRDQNSTKNFQKSKKIGNNNSKYPKGGRGSGLASFGDRNDGEDYDGDGDRSIRNGALVYNESSIRASVWQVMGLQHQLRKLLHSFDNCRQNIYIREKELSSFRDTHGYDSMTTSSSTSTFDPHPIFNLIYPDLLASSAEQSSPPVLIHPSSLSLSHPLPTSLPPLRPNYSYTDPLFGNISDDVYVEYSQSFCNVLSDKCGNSQVKNDNFEVIKNHYTTTSSSNNNSRNNSTGISSSSSSSSLLYSNNYDSRAYQFEFDDLLKEINDLRGELKSSSASGDRNQCNSSNNSEVGEESKLLDSIQMQPLGDLISRNEVLNSHLPPISVTLKLKRFISQYSVVLTSLTSSKSRTKSKSRGRAGSFKQRLTFDLLEAWMDLFVPVTPTLTPTDLSSSDFKDGYGAVLLSLLASINTLLLPLAEVIKDLVTLYMALRATIDTYSFDREGAGPFYQVIINSSSDLNDHDDGINAGGEDFAIISKSDSFLLSAFRNSNSYSNNNSINNESQSSDEDKDGDDEHQRFARLFAESTSVVDKLRLSTLILPTLNTMFLYTAAAATTNDDNDDNDRDRVRDRDREDVTSSASCANCAAVSSSMTEDSARALDLQTSHMIERYSCYIRPDTLFSLLGSLSFQLIPCNHHENDLNHDHDYCTGTGTCTGEVHTDCRLCFVTRPLFNSLTKLYSLINTDLLHIQLCKEAFNKEEKEGEEMEEESDDAVRSIHPGELEYSISSSSRGSQRQINLVPSELSKKKRSSATSKLTNANDFLDSFYYKWTKSSSSLFFSTVKNPSLLQELSRSSDDQFAVNHPSYLHAYATAHVHARLSNSKLIGLVHRLKTLFSARQDLRLVADVCVNLFPVLTVNHVLFIMGYSSSSSSSSEVYDDSDVKDKDKNALQKSHSRRLKLRRVINTAVESIDGCCNRVDLVWYHNSYLSKLLRKHASPSLPTPPPAVTTISSSRNEKKEKLSFSPSLYSNHRKSGFFESETASSRLVKSALTLAFLDFVDLSFYLLNCYGYSVDYARGDRLGLGLDANIAASKRRIVVSSLREVIVNPNASLYRTIAPTTFIAFCTSVCNLSRDKEGENNDSSKDRMRDKALFEEEGNDDMLFDYREGLVIIIKNFLAAQDNLKTSFPLDRAHELLDIATQFIVEPEVNAIYSYSAGTGCRGYGRGGSGGGGDIDACNLSAAAAVEGHTGDDNSFQILNYHTNILSQAFRVVYALDSILFTPCKPASGSSSSSHVSDRIGLLLHHIIQRTYSSSSYSNSNSNSSLDGNNKQVLAYCVSNALTTALGYNMGSHIVDGCEHLSSYLTASYYRNRKMK